MKMKLLLFTGLLIASAGLSMLLTNNAYAIGESYKWIDKTTIEGSGGSYGQSTGVVKDGNAGPSRPVAVGTVRFTRVGTTAQFKAPTDIYNGSTGGAYTGSQKCDLQLSITLASVDKGTLAINDQGKTACTQTQLTTAVTVADSGKGATAAELNVAGATNAPPPPGTTGTASSCKVDGIGWIICPVVNLMGLLVDGAYGFVGSLLKIQPLVSTGAAESKAIYDAWTIMRNFANVAFVIAFLIIIFSQLTSVGLNNYGIKKMLPRLIVAAILVNVSFWICAIAVDISNILGVSVNNLFQNGIPTTDNVTQFTGDDGQTGNGFAGIAGIVLVGAGMTIGILYATLSALIPALLAALIAIATVFIVLTIRQALVILLIIISPLAFVAYLLPNTESLFRKWMGLFKTLLLMFPIIALIFGASALASKIVMGSASGPYAVAVQIMGALIAIIPLALTPVIMKTAGGFLNRIGGVINNPNKGPVDALRKKATGFRDYRQDIARGNRLDRGGKILERSGGPLGKEYSRRRKLASMATSFGATTSVNANQQKGFAKAVADESAQEYFAKRALGEPGFAKQITGDEGKAVSLQASSQNAVDKLEADSVKSREVLLRARFDPRDLQVEAAETLKNAIIAGDVTGARAAQNILLTSGSPGLAKLSQTLQDTEDSGALGTEVSTSLRKDINGAGLKGRDNTLATWSYKNESLGSIIKSPDTYSGLSDKELLGQSEANLKHAVATGVIDRSRAEALLKSDNLGADFNAAKRDIISRAAPSSPPSGSEPTS